MESKYTLDELKTVLEVANETEELVRRFNANPELKARYLCPHCRCYDREVLDRAMLHGVPCGMPCLRGLANWIDETARERIMAHRAVLEALKPMAQPRQEKITPGEAATVGPDDWHMCGPGEQLK